MSGEGEKIDLHRFHIDGHTPGCLRRIEREPDSSPQIFPISAAA